MGDGICCSYGNGGYSVKVNDEEVASGGDFDSEETKTFEVVSNTDSPVAPPTTSAPIPVPTAGPTQTSPTSNPNEPTPTLFPTHTPPTMYPTHSVPTMYPTHSPPTMHPTTDNTDPVPLLSLPMSHQLLFLLHKIVHPRANIVANIMIVARKNAIRSRIFVGNSMMQQ